MITSTTHVISANLYRQLPYDSLRDFTMVMKLAEGPYVLVVHPALAANSVADLVSLAKAQPGRIDYASSGNGSSQHLVAALFCAMSGAPLNHIPYQRQRPGDAGHHRRPGESRLRRHADRPAAREVRVVRAEHAKWGKVVRETGATVN